MILLSLIIFAFSSWAVFSHRFDDGLLVKNILSLGAIISFLPVLDHDNKIACAGGIVLLTLGMLIWLFQHRKHLTFPSVNRLK